MSLIPQGTGIPGPAGPAGPQGTSGLTATLSQVLANGNTSGPNDIVMLDGVNKQSIRNADELEADTIYTDTIKPGIGALSDVVIVEANLNIKEGVTAGEGVIEFELCNGTILTQGTNTLDIESDTLTAKTISGNQSLALNASAKTANLTSVSGNITGQHYTQPNTNTNTQVGMRYTDPTAGIFRRVEVGADINGPYTRLDGLIQNNTADIVLTYAPSSGNVAYKQIPIETNLYIKGDLLVQNEIPTAVFDNETYNVVNDGIDPVASVISIPLTPQGNQAYIPFFTRDGSQAPTNTISDNGQFFPAYPPIPTSGRVRCMVSDPINPKVYVACYGPAGQNGTLVYSFDMDTNAWSQLLLIDGEVYDIFLDGNDLYLGGSFNNTESVAGGGPISGKNIIRVEISTLTPIPVAGSLNASVNCFAKWNGYIAVGGKFDNEVTGVNFFQKFALYDKALNQFFNINQGTSAVLNDWGFNDQVYSLAVLPQTNTLLIGGDFTQQYANSITYTYKHIVQYQVLGTFNSVGDNSLTGGIVSKIFVDYEGGLVYIAGDFNTSVGQYLVATPVNTLNTYKNIGWNGGGFTNNYPNAITKDELGGFIWIVNVNDGSLWRFNPNVNISNAYEDVSTLLGFTSPRAVMYSWFDRSVHISLEAGDVYYRFYCDQRVKIKQNNGDLFVLNDGSEYDVLVLPKKGSSLTVRGGLSTPSKWYVFGASQGVYGEWETGQITEPANAYATALCTDTATGLGSITFGWNSVVGKNINLQQNLSGKIVVKQKGLYKMSFRVNAYRNGGGGGNAHSDIYVWFMVNNIDYQQTNTQFVVIGNGRPASVYNEVFVELNIDDFVGVRLECPTNDVDVITTPATSTQPQIPGVIFNIQLVNPTREPFV